MSMFAERVRASLVFFWAIAFIGAIVWPLSIDAAQATDMPPPPSITAFSELFRDANIHFAGLGHALMRAPAQAKQLWTDFAEYTISREGITTIAYTLIVVMIATGLEWLFWTYAGSARRAIDAAQIHSRQEGFRMAFRRLTLLMCGFTLFALSILGSMGFFVWPEKGEHTVLALILLIVFVRLVWILADSMLAPGRARHRLLDVSLSTSQVWVTAIVCLAFLASVAVVVVPLIEAVGAADVAQTLRIVVATLSAGLTLVTIVRPWKTGKRPDANKWARPPMLPLTFLRTTIVLSIYGLWLFCGTVPAILAIIFLLAFATQRRLRSVVVFLCTDESYARTCLPEKPPETELAVKLPVSLMSSIILMLARYTVVIVAIAGALMVLNVPILETATTSTPLRLLIGHLLGLAGLALVAHIAWLAVRLPIDLRLRDLVENADPLHGLGSNARLVTLLPLIRSAFGLTLLLLFAILALWSLNVDIAPLLAGAGVFGLALGFGAQALVRDVISGIFYLADDVLRVGEYIEGGGDTRGTVERITLRTVALRHHNGPLYFVPFGILGCVKNNSRDWAIDKFNIPLPVSVDSELVRKVIKKVGEQMLNDPDIGPGIVEPLKTRVHSIEPGIKIFRCKFRCAPGNQFDIRMQAYKRIEVALKAAGIPFAAGTQVLMAHEHPPKPAA
ncbi:MscS Mechanosensitive ion channel [Rhizobium sp. PDO1-076]|uniref:mechanosensitive ion channel family protein n=1 Tax=Rhizobium sp. PDO1-076 TaxID=1125979 RepID=UPI00024E3946|nr:mechanosensitive ion channel domain-containing protein [Rhizobium sp. PDO1-076]EHS52055.1 MscS Mechanosensitive ion channel [Rhizobium sp. PDO1-076]